MKKKQNFVQIKVYRNDIHHRTTEVNPTRRPNKLNKWQHCCLWISDDGMMQCWQLLLQVIKAKWNFPGRWVML